MATSGVSTFNATRNEIISAALRKLQVKSHGTTISAEMNQECDFALNSLVKRLQARGLHVWTVQEATLFPQLLQVRYALAKTSADYCAATNSYTTKTITAAEESGQTTISVTSSTGMTASDKIGIVGDDGTIHWTTISSVPGATSVVIAVALDAAAAAGNYVHFYTSNIVRPLRIVSARRYKIDSVTAGTETPIIPISHLDYQALPNKMAAGTVNQVYYDAPLSTGDLYLWQKPDDVDTLIRFTWHRPIEDFSAAGDNPDMPQEWIDALVFNLALVMAPEYCVNGQRLTEIAALATSFLDEVSGFDREDTSIFFAPDLG